MHPETATHGAPADQLDPSLGLERPRWAAQGAAREGAAVHPSLASLGGQRLEAGFPGAGTHAAHAGDQLRTAAQLVGSDRPSTLPLFEKLSLEDEP